MNLTLHRIALGPLGTFGVLVKDNLPLCLTCEDPWRNNEPERSCIPTGTYKVTPHNGSKYKDVWRLNNVPGRSDILIHNGNTESDTRGCLLVGSSFGTVNGLPAVLNSIGTLNMLRQVLPGNFTLTIKE